MPVDGFVNDGLRFEVSVTGPVGGRAVILLHGFPNDRTAWDVVAPELAAAGLRVLVPNQRGYSPAARPGRRRAYRLDRLVDDVLALADQADAERFDVVGHDWGAVVAYDLAARHPHRVRTVTALSAPHPGAWLQSLIRSTQVVRSTYMLFFQLPLLPERLLGAGSAKRLRRMLTASGLNDRHAARYAARAARPHGLTGPLNWYRAFALYPHRVARVPVPTLLVYGTRDRFISPTAAHLCEQWVTGPYRLTELEDATHWIPEEEPARLTTLILEHFKRFPGRDEAAYDSWSPS
jgi:pimeloyl-ACP methyl ester carboxylesterase